MGLGSFILRSAVKSATRGATRTMSTAVTSAVAAGAATAASIAVANAMNNRMAQRTGNGAVYAGNQNARNIFADNMIAKIAVCNYIAKSDGYVSPAEQMEIDSIISEFLCNSNITDVAKREVEKISSLPSISFAAVEGYLNKVDSKTLISFANDVKTIANSSEGIQPAEAKAMEIFERYVTAKTGYTFEKQAASQKVTEVNLTCDCCNGTMELDQTMLKATCPYCGSAKIIDASQISAVMSEIERTKRENGGF